MKANIEKLKELTLAELITINQFNISTFNFISEISVKDRTEKQNELFTQVSAIGYEFNELISKKLNEFIIK